MGEFIKKLYEHAKEEESDTVGWIQFMPPKGIKAAENCIFRLQAIENWRPKLSCVPQFNDESSFEKYLSDHMLPDEYKNDILEGRCVYSEFPHNTEFASCYTVIHKRDIDQSTRKLTKGKKQEFERYGTKHKDFIYIKSSNLLAFGNSIYNSFINCHNKYVCAGNTPSPVYIRPVLYMNSHDYYWYGVEAEDISDIRNGLPIVKDEQAAKSVKNQDGGYFGIFAKLKHFEKQQEARIGVTFSYPINFPFLDIKAPCSEQFFTVCDAADIDTITF
ncbi:hypothetical protein ACVXZW_06440 [Lacticaseibacillus paracasei]|uniref:Uncharacterized protein n=2 Tax=Lacticaseibacillus paracasei TaxID=1597 RepID=A0A806LEL3_LACPA|nr:hypothetical protein [Lacticaseibacillus paracasei]AHJ34411.1 hypothetical protein AF91_02740 [Lacticaseibacillus paracasei N1115]EPC52906.1 hypothetical protein Lpp7_06495 [Lacticaseibacillus paracasei subsp. paracasei Lpp7]